MTTADLLLYRTWLTDRISSTAWSSTVSPLAARNTQYLKETFGSTEEKVRCTSMIDYVAWLTSCRLNYPMNTSTSRRESMP